MREVGAELWQWLGEGAHFYVCGDAKRMAKDVERALVGSSPPPTATLAPTSAVAFVQDLKKSGPLSGRRLLSADDGPRARTDRRRSR